MKAIQCPERICTPRAGSTAPRPSNYGILVLPNLFIVGADGKVVSRNAQTATMEEEIKKLIK